MKERIIKKKINRLKRVLVKELKNDLTNSKRGYDNCCPACTLTDFKDDVKFVVELLEKPQRIYFKIPKVNYEKGLYNGRKTYVKECEKELKKLQDKKYKGVK